MRPIVRWLQKRKSGKRPDPGVPQFPPDRIGRALVIGSLALIFIAIAIIAISDARLSKGIVGRPYATVTNAEAKPADPRLTATSTSGHPSSLPPHVVVLKGLPGRLYQTHSLASQTHSLERKPRPRPSGGEMGGRWRPFPPRLLAVARDGTGMWPKTFVMYLVAHQGYLRKIQRHRQTGDRR